MLTTPYTRSTFWSIFLGVLLLIAGLIAIALPPIAGIAASVFFGWLLLIAGIAHLVYAWSERGAGAVIWQVLIGVVYVIAALYMLVLPVAGMAALTLVLACDGCGERSGSWWTAWFRYCLRVSSSFIGRGVRCGSSAP
jgi:uncharacterized membrane protein HdeD (DUF308 family)